MELRIPKLDVTMIEGTFLGWLVEDGATVEEGEDVYTVGTDKVEVDIPAPAGGVLHYGDADIDEVYAVGTVVGTVIDD